MDVLFVISHKPDNRYKKRLDLLKHKYETGIVFWNKEVEKQNFTMDGVSSFEIHVTANRTNPLKRIPQTIMFISQAYKKVKKLAPKYVYVGNLDMLLVAVRYKIRHKGVKIIYEIADLHRLIIDKQSLALKKYLSKILRILEKYFTKDVDCLVLTSMKFFDVYYSDFVDKNKVVFLPNMPKEDSFNGFEKHAHDKFTIGFIGWIRYKDQLKMLIEAADRANVDVVFAGEDGDGEDFKHYCSQFAHVSYLGPFNYEREIQQMYQRIDCVYAVYDADMANVRVALPNKLYESMLCEMPIIVAKNTYLSELVLEMGIGSAVSHNCIEDLIEELKRLSTDSNYYNKICQNCKTQKQTVNLNNFNSTLLTKIEEVAK